MGFITIKPPPFERTCVILFPSTQEANLNISISRMNIEWTLWKQTWQRTITILLIGDTSSFMVGFPASRSFVFQGGAIVHGLHFLPSYLLSWEKMSCIFSQAPNLLKSKQKDSWENTPSIQRVKTQDGKLKMSEMKAYCKSKSLELPQDPIWAMKSLGPWLAGGYVRAWNRTQLY